MRTTYRTYTTLRTTHGRSVSGVVQADRETHIPTRPSLNALCSKLRLREGERFLESDMYTSRRQRGVQ